MGQLVLEGQPRLPSTPAKKPLLPHTRRRGHQHALAPMLGPRAGRRRGRAPPYTRIEREAAPQLTIIPRRSRTCAQACVRKGEGYVYAANTLRGRPEVALY